MKWIPVNSRKIDRIACPWLIAEFIDQEAEFLYVPANEVLRLAEETKAIRYDIPGVELAHVSGLCSFDAFLKKYALNDPALAHLATIVRGADTSRLDLTLRQLDCTRSRLGYTETFRMIMKCSSTAW